MSVAPLRPVLLLLALPLLERPSSPAADVPQVWLATGEIVPVTAVRVDPAGGATVTLAQGGIQTLSFEQMVQIEFPPPRSSPSFPVVAAAGPAGAAVGGPAGATLGVVNLHDGGRLVGRIMGGDDEKLLLELAGGPRLELPIDGIAALFLGPRAALFDRASFHPSEKDDSLHRRAEAGGDFTRGTLEAFSAEGVRFRYSLGVGDFPWGELEAVILAHQVDLEAAKPPVMHVDLLPDGTLSGTLVRVNDEGVVIRPAGFPADVVLPRSVLRALRFATATHLWLSDLPPTRVEQTPWLGAADEFLFPWRADRSVTGRPLAVAGRRFTKGFGCHSRTLLEFPLDGSFRTFRAWVGVADEVAELADRGAVQFVVLLDGKEAWKSPVLHGGEPAAAVGPLKLEGVHTLSLLTDFGEGEDVADRAVWGAPLLLR